jgi:hypothetical protein
MPGLCIWFCVVKKGHGKRLAICWFTDYCQLLLGSGFFPFLYLCLFDCYMGEFIIFLMNRMSNNRMVYWTLIDVCCFYVGSEY